MVWIFDLDATIDFEVKMSRYPLLRGAKSISLYTHVGIL